MILGITIGVVAVIAVICIGVGLSKGFTKTKSWGWEYALTATITLSISSFVDFDNSILHACVVFGTAVVLLLLFAFISSAIRWGIVRKVADTRMYSYYETYDEREQNILEIRDAIERGDKELYYELTKNEIKEESGACGVLDRFLGMLSMLVKGVVICSMTAVIIFLLLQFTQLPFVLEGGALYSVYESEIWQYLTPYILDLIVLAIIQGTIRASYRAGLLRALFGLVVFVLVLGVGFAANWLAFNTETFINFAANTGYQLIAQLIILAVLFVIGLVIVIVLATVVSRAISNAREAKAVSVIDGIFGAVIFTAIVMAILLLLGMLLYSFHDFAIMDALNSYSSPVVNGQTQSTVFFSCLYEYNPLNDISVFADFQSTLAGIFTK